MADREQLLEKARKKLKKFQVARGGTDNKSGDDGSIAADLPEANALTSEIVPQKSKQEKENIGSSMASKKISENQDSKLPDVPRGRRSSSTRRIVVKQVLEKKKTMTTSGNYAEPTLISNTVSSSTHSAALVTTFPLDKSDSFRASRSSLGEISNQLEGLLSRSSSYTDAYVASLELELESRNAEIDVLRSVIAGANQIARYRSDLNNIQDMELLRAWNHQLCNRVTELENGSTLNHAQPRLITAVETSKESDKAVQEQLDVVKSSEKVLKSRISELQNTLQSTQEKSSQEMNHLREKTRLLEKEYLGGKRQMDEIASMLKQTLEAMDNKSSDDMTDPLDMACFLQQYVLKMKQALDTRTQTKTIEDRVALLKKELQLANDRIAQKEVMMHEQQERCKRLEKDLIASQQKEAAVRLEQQTLNEKMIESSKVVEQLGNENAHQRLTIKQQGKDELKDERVDRENRIVDLEASVIFLQKELEKERLSSQDTILKLNQHIADQQQKMQALESTNLSMSENISRYVSAREDLTAKIAEKSGKKAPAKNCSLKDWKSWMMAEFETHFESALDAHRIVDTQHLIIEGLRKKLADQEAVPTVQAKDQLESSTQTDTTDHPNGHPRPELAIATNNLQENMLKNTLRATSPSPLKSSGSDSAGSESFTENDLQQRYQHLERINISLTSRLEHQIQANSEIKKLIIDATVGGNAPSGSAGIFGKSTPKPGDNMLEKYNDCLFELGRIQEELEFWKIKCEELQVIHDKLTRSSHSPTLQTLLENNVKIPQTLDLSHVCSECIDGKLIVL